jgi:hypothetical protein
VRVRADDAARQYEVLRGGEPMGREAGGRRSGARWERR